MNFVLKLIAVSLTLSSVVSHADIITGRCPEKGESLTGDQANERWEWVKRCDPIGYRYNVGSRKAFQGGKERVTYPIYGVYTHIDSGTYKLSGWKAPTDRNAPCNIPEGHDIVAFCFAGCYTLDQQVALLEAGSGFDAEAFLSSVEALSYDSEESMAYGMNYEGAKAARDLRALVWQQDASELVSFSDQHKVNLVPSLIDEDHKILVFTTESGKELKVTTTHPLVDGKGVMRTAESLTTKDALTNTHGDAEKIVNIREEKYHGKVWNVDVQNSDPFQKIVVAQGFLNGDVSYQNENTRLLNQMVMRQHLPVDLLD